MYKSTVELSFDGRLKSFDRDMLETAYLVMLDTPELFSGDVRAERKVRIMRRLRDEFEFSKGDAALYTVGAFIWARPKT